jgi:hypothetical protein
VQHLRLEQLRIREQLGRHGMQHWMLGGQRSLPWMQQKRHCEQQHFYENGQQRDLHWNCENEI